MPEAGRLRPLERYAYRGEDLNTPGFSGAFVGSESATIGSAGSLTVNVPTGVVDGDELIAVISPMGDGGGTPSNVTTPAGWTLINSGQTDLPATASTPSMWVYRRTASSEPASYAFTIDQTCSIAGTILAYRDVDTPEDVISAINTGTDAAPVNPSIVPSAEAFVLWLMTNDDTADTPAAVPAGTTERVIQTITGVGNGGGQSIAEESLPAGATGTRTWTLGASEQWGAISVAFTKAPSWAVSDAAEEIDLNGVVVRQFDDTTEEGVGFLVEIPDGATKVKIKLKSRALTPPGSAETVVPRLYVREVPDNAAVEAWSAGTDLTSVSLPATNPYFQYDEQEIDLSTLSLVAGRLAQFELTRNTGAGGDTLVGDWVLGHLIAEFS